MAATGDDSSLAQTYGPGAPELFSRLGQLSEIGGHAGVTRYLYDLYCQRPDLQQVFPNIEGDDAYGLVYWAYRYGRDEVPIAPELLPTAWLREPSADGVMRYLAQLHARLPPLREEFPDVTAPALAEWARTVGAEHDPVLCTLLNGDPPPPRRHGPPTIPGVNVIGFLRAELGLGEAARLVIAALDAARVPLLPVGRTLGSSRDGHSFASIDIDRAGLGTNLVCLNPDQHWALMREAGSSLAADRYTIGFWWWEVAGAVPIEWRMGFRLVDEVWAGSDHTAAAIRAVAPVPVVKMRIPVAPSPVPRRSRNELGLPPGFLFLMMFDYNSTIERKNPLGATEAFKAAFPPGSGAALALKSVNAERHPDKRATVEAAAAGHPDIHVIDRYVDAGEKNAMLAACDAYVSLHRAEGFGLPLAEAMYLGKPAIATAYSGSQEFTTRENSYLVPHGMTRVGNGAQEVYPSDGEWAEPDLRAATDAMRAVFEDPEEAARRGRRAAADLRRDFSPEAVGQAMRARLDSLRADPPADHELRDTLAVLERAVGGDPALARGGGLSARARQLALRLMRPFTFHQRRLDERLVEAVEDLQRRVARAETDAALARAEALLELRRRDGS